VAAGAEIRGPTPKTKKLSISQEPQIGIKEEPFCSYAAWSALAARAAAATATDALVRKQAVQGLRPERSRARPSPPLGAVATDPRDGPRATRGANGSASARDALPLLVFELVGGDPAAIAGNLPSPGPPTTEPTAREKRWPGPMIRIPTGVDVPQRHTVRQGDCIASISFRNGFLPETIWNDPNNAELRRTKHPNILKPGDIVFIPDKRPKTSSLKTPYSPELYCVRCVRLTSTQTCASTTSRRSPEMILY
jgi:hypothetical protein